MGSKTVGSSCSCDLPVHYTMPVNYCSSIMACTGYVFCITLLKKVYKQESESLADNVHKQGMYSGIAQHCYILH